MDHLYIKYIHRFSVLMLGTLIIAGIVAFIIQGYETLTIHKEFSVMHVVFLLSL